MIQRKETRTSDAGSPGSFLDEKMLRVRFVPGRMWAGDSFLSEQSQLSLCLLHFQKPRSQFLVPARRVRWGILTVKLRDKGLIWNVYVCLDVRVVRRSRPYVVSG